ncbi:MAG: hypothetical protein ACOYW7_05820 [Nitrospirota bacterium]
MAYEAVVDRVTQKWWKELKQYKKENWCCNTFKESAFEEFLKLEFDALLPVRFSVNYCCQCGSPMKDGYERNEDEKEDWCCRLMRGIGFEWLEFKSANNEISTMRVNHCLNCGRKLRNTLKVKVHTCDKEDKCC